MRILAPISLVLVTASVFAITLSTIGPDQVKPGAREAAPLVADDLPPLRPLASAAR
jgi:hypothetical protein